MYTPLCIIDVNIERRTHPEGFQSTRGEDTSFELSSSSPTMSSCDGPVGVTHSTPKGNEQSGTKDRYADRLNNEIYRPSKSQGKNENGGSHGWVTRRTKGLYTQTGF